MTADTERGKKTADAERRQLTADAGKISEGTIYLLAETGVDSRETETGVRWLQENQIPVSRIVSITSPDEIAADTYVLLKGDYAYVERMAAALAEQNIPFDYAGNWLGCDIDMGYLQAMHAREYMDLYQNKVILARKLPAGIVVRRTARGERIFTKQNTIRIGSVKYVTRQLLFILYGNRGYIRVGDGCTFRNCEIEIGTRGHVIIGRDVMVSRGVVLFQHDGHLIFDANTGKRLNAGKNITVGNHVWLGRQCMLLGGAQIPDNTVVGAESVTSKQFTETDTIIAGSPARVVRRGVLWARDTTTNDFQNYEECRDQEAVKYMINDKCNEGGGYWNV